MSNINKILLVVVIVLLAVLIGLLVWQQFSVSKPSFYAVYLRTGDLYFGELSHFPYFGLKRVYTLQVNPQGSATPLSIQKLTNIIWGPEDFLKINREEVVWITKLRSDSQLLQVIQANPNLQLPQGNLPNATSSPQ